MIITTVGTDHCVEILYNSHSLYKVLITPILNLSHIAGM